MTVRVHRSTDTGAPILTAAAGSLFQLLDACLVRGYAATRATATITQSGVPNDADTVTVDGKVYTFKTALTPLPNEVLIGTAAVSLVNLLKAMYGWGTAGTEYGAGTTHQTNTQCITNTTTVATIHAHVGGTGGNSITITESATNYLVSGATLTGGAGTDTTASSGWSKTGTSGGTNQGAFRGAAGVRHYLEVNDNGPGAAYGKECRLRGYETYGSTFGSGGLWAYPTATQLASGTVVRKSASQDSTNRAWKLFSNDRTFYLFANAGDGVSWYLNAWGEFRSYMTGDNFKSFIMGRFTENSTSTLVATDTPSYIPHNSNVHIAQGGHYIARGYVGTGASVTFVKMGDATFTSSGGGTPMPGAGAFAFPNPVDGGLYMAPLRVLDVSTAPTFNVRGELPGFFTAGHPYASFVEGVVLSGATGTAYAGRTFEVVHGLAGNSGYYILETSDWDVNLA